MTNHAHELPAAGKTTPSARIADADSSGTNLSILETVERYDVSERTLRRDLSEGKVTGAHKVTGLRGESWRLPIAGLQMLYKERKQLADSEQAPSERVQESALELELRRRAEQAEIELDRVKAQLEQMTSRALEAGNANDQEKSALLERAIRAEAILEAREELDRLAQSRRWWKRKP